MTASAAGLSAFRAEMLDAGTRPARNRAVAWDTWAARRHRRDLAWAFYNGDAYDPAHPWSPSFRSSYSLYPGARPVANPVYRLVEFYVAHLLGGDLDPAAGDGKDVPSCLPIVPGVGADPRLAAAIARFWQDCQFGEMKDRIGLFGAVEGEVAVRLVDEPARRRVRAEIVSTADLADVSWNPGGTSVQSYDLRQMVDDPRVARDPDDPPPLVEYRETAARGDGGVRYETWLDGKPYAWNGKQPRWAEPYPFVPLVIAKHRDLGRGRSVNAFHSAIARIVEADQQTSILSDANRKQLRMPMMFTGVPEGALDDDADAAASARDGLGRRPYRASRAAAHREADDVQSFSTSNPDARAIHLRYQMDNAGARAHIDALLHTLALDYPELRVDQATMAGTPTAEAIRLARSECTKRVNARRAGYHALVVRMNQVAVAIGGARGYPGYEGFDFSSYDRGLLDHRIGPAAVFEDSEDDRIARAGARAAVIAKLVKDGGMGLEDACLEAGIDPDRARRIAAAKARADDEALRRSEASLRADQAATLADDDEGG